MDERMTQQYEDFNNMDEENSQAPSYTQEQESEEDAAQTHDSRVVKTVRSLKKQKRPESATVNKQKLQVTKQLTEEYQPAENLFNNKTLLR